MREILTRGLAAYALDPSAAATLEQYAALLLEKNRVMNLTAITEATEVAQKHMLDCAGVLGAADFRGKSVLDVGTGAGFPGLVLQICEPSIQLTLLDGLQKRVDWLAEISGVLGAPAHCIHARAEELSHEAAYRERFDLVTARAVADLRVLCELCLPYVRVGGMFLAMKTDHSAEEIAAAAQCIALLGGAPAEEYDYTVPHTALHRQVVRIEKVAATPEKYPRRFAKIQRNPL